MKVFGVWETEDIEVNDIGLQKYISLAGGLHSHGRQAEKQFAKSKMSLVERLINNLMRSGSRRKIGGKKIHDRFGSGKKEAAYSAVKQGFEIIEKKTKQNPVQVLVTEVENSAPREETTRVKRGGITQHIAVDSSPQRRIDIALRNICLGAMLKAYKSKRTRGAALAEEIILASNNDTTSFAVSKKNELERIAKCAR